MNGPCAPFWSVHKISYEVAVENGVIGAVVADILLLGNDMQFEHILRLASKDRFKDKCNIKISKVITSLSTFWTWLERAVTEARPSSTSWQISSCFWRTSMVYEKLGYMDQMRLWRPWREVSSMRTLQICCVREHSCSSFAGAKRALWSYYPWFPSAHLIIVETLSKAVLVSTTLPIASMGLLIFTYIYHMYQKKTQPNVGINIPWKLTCALKMDGCKMYSNSIFPFKLVPFQVTPPVHFRGPIYSPMDGPGPRKHVCVSALASRQGAGATCSTYPRNNYQVRDRSLGGLDSWVVFRGH